MTSVKVKENESFENAFRRFKRACEKADIVNRFKDKMFYEKPTWARKRMKEAAMKRSYYLRKQFIV